MRKGAKKSHRHPQVVKREKGRARTSMQPGQELSLGLVWAKLKSRP